MAGLTACYGSNETKLSRPRMKKVYYIFLTIALLISGCGKHSPQGVTAVQTPIELSPSGEWSDLSRSVINDLNDLTGDGFVAWANWTKDPEDESIFTNDYGSGVTNLVFGEHGTKVYATDGDGDRLFTPVQQILDTWYYTPKRYWQRGTYTFAAALPATAFNASCVKEESDATGTANITGTLGLDNTLTLTFGQDENERPLGFDLAANQIDLMVAFSDVDNRKEDANVAELDFRKHHFAQIVIEAASIDENADIIVDEVVFYGNHKATTGPMTFTNEEDGVTATYEIDAETATAPENPYMVISDINQELPHAVKKADDTWEHNYNPIVTGLLVFPEESVMSIVVRYRTFMGDNTVTSQQIEASVTTTEPVTWLEGKKHLYKLQISRYRVDITSTGVLEWDEKEITHTFS